MIDEGAAKTLIAKDRPAELADASGRGQQAGTLEVEVADALQEKVVLLIQEVGAEFFGGRHHVPGWRVLLAVEAGLFVVTKALAVRNLGRFWSSVKKMRPGKYPFPWPLAVYPNVRQITCSQPRA